MTDDELMQRAGVDPERSASLLDTARLLAAALDLSERTRHLVVMYKADPERPPGSRYTIIAGPVDDGMRRFRRDADDLAEMLRDYLRYVIEGDSLEARVLDDGG